MIYLRKNGLSTNLFSVGDLIKFSAYFGTLIWPIEAVGRLIDMHSQGKASLNRVCKIIDAEKEINDSLVTEECKNITTLEGDIEYRNLSFSYPNDSKKVLHNVNLKINKGEFVGIIGETGSGKTTIVDLLLRLYNIDANMLFIDDHDIMNLPLKTVRNNIAYVPQDNFLYGDKIIEHHISTICKDVNKDCLPIYVAPEGYLMTNGYCYKKTEDGSIEYTSPILVGFKTEDGVKNLTEIYEQIYGLYETEDKTTDSVAECNNYLDSTTYVKNKKLSI